MATLGTPIEQHRGRAIHVGDDEDASNYVRLIIDLDPGETIGGNRRPGPDLLGAVERIRALGNEGGPLHDHPAALDLATVLEDYDRLERDRQTTEEWSHIWRDLLPGEARAIGAALRHFAGEAEAGRR